MDHETHPADFEDELAEGIAAGIAADTAPNVEIASDPADLADLFLFELNRLWADPAPLHFA
jgi:hypothetical protein